MKKLSKYLAVFLLSFMLAGCGTAASQNAAEMTAGTGSFGQNALTDNDDSGGSANESAEGKESGRDSPSVDKDGAGGEDSENHGSSEGRSPTESGGSAGINSTKPGGSEAGNPAAAGGDAADSTESDEFKDSSTVEEDGAYTSKEDVAQYLYLYGHLPSNFITKKEAEKLGWKGGSLEAFAPGMCIGGSRFGNYEGLLPEKEGRFYTECDIDTLGADKRGAKRIVFSNDGLIYYTEDHYNSFELLYGE